MCPVPVPAGRACALPAGRALCRACRVATPGPCAPKAGQAMALDGSDCPDDGALGTIQSTWNSSNTADLQRSAKRKIDEYPPF